MHEKPRVSSVISVCNNQQTFKEGFLSVALAQWVRRWSSSHRVMHIEGLSPGGSLDQFLFQQ